VERGWNKLVRFFPVHLGDVPGGDPLTAVRAEYSSVVLREIDGAVDNPVVVHLYKIAFAHFLIVGGEAFAVGAANL